MIGISGSYSGSVSWLAFIVWVRVFVFVFMFVFVFVFVFMFVFVFVFVFMFMFMFMFVFVFGSVAFLMIAEECSSVGAELFVWQNSAWVVWIAKSM